MDMSGFVGSSSGSSTIMFSSPLSNEEWRSKECLVGSGLLKQGRRGGLEENEWRYAKVGRASDVTEKTALLRSSNSPLFGGQQMVSFSSVPKQDGLMLCNDGTLPYHHLTSSSPSSSSYGRTSGLGSGSSFSVNMLGAMGVAKGAFTPSQWMELEHQAIIYKCLDANVPIPPSLLISIQRSLNPAGYTGYSAASLRPNAFGWGSFPLGFSNSSDPEPGRCRRTDGKKWRCSRDAVIDQKYCERHLNRGRHRSRKPVEGQSGHGKAMPTITSPTPAASTICSSGLINSISNTQQDMKISGTTGLSTTPFHRISTNEEIVNDHPEFPGINPGTKMTRYVCLGQQKADLSLISPVSYLNPSKNSCVEGRTCAPKLIDEESQPNSTRHFMDNWFKTQSDRSASIWPDVDVSQLPISIPKDISSSYLSQEKMTLSFLKQSADSDQIHMGLAVGNVNQRQSNWAPISWEASVGGPLGEVLNSNKNTAENNTLKSSNTTLNLLTYGWDSSNLRPVSSPTGVLQKTAFGSLSSSAGSSPRAGSLCDDLLGSVS